MWREALLGAAAVGSACLLRSKYKKKHFSVEETEIFSPKIQKDRVFVFLSDLHNNEFGSGNSRLLRAVEQIRPDAVLSGGDMMVCKGKRDIQVPLALFQALSEKVPVYCGNGNHENRMTWEREVYGGLYEEYKHRLMEMGIHFLENSTEDFGEDISITGLDLERACYRKALFKRLPSMPEIEIEKKVGKNRAQERGRFSILLAHSPAYFESYAQWGADLTLSGHFHGGTIRLPGLGGVMTPQYQFFFPWCAGLCERHGKKMVVSRGLGTHSINIRLNNRPQLAVIRLRKG